VLGVDWLHRLRGTDLARTRGQAAALVNEATASSEAGRHAEAAAAGDQAVQLLRAVRRERRADEAPLLADALVCRSVARGALGDVTRALRDAEEAYRLAREVAAAGTGRPESLPLAQANLAARLLQAGRAATALPHARSAADAAGLPEPVAARIQDTLAQVSAAGESTGAPGAARQTRIVLQRTAGDEAPDTDLDVERARAHTNQANRLLAAGRWQEAVDTVAQAVALHRALVARNRPARLPGLARALSNQAIMLSKVARWEEALVASGEAVTLQREISAADPVAGRPGLASALSAYATALATSDRIAEARPLMAESLAIFRSLASSDRNAYLTDLAEAVSNHAYLAETDEERIRLSTETIRLRRELAGQNRAVHLPWLARALNLLSGRLADVGRLGPALEAGHEAVELARESFAANRAAFLPHHAFILREQASLLDEAGMPAAAVALGAEAVDICREAAAANRRREASGLATALSRQADRLLAQPMVSERQAEEAARLRAEAAALRGED
jgi:tetratricopeptide (TPR) repeat protein